MEGFVEEEGAEFSLSFPSPARDQAIKRSGHCVRQVGQTWKAWLLWADSPEFEPGWGQDQIFFCAPVDVKWVIRSPGIFRYTADGRIRRFEFVPGFIGHYCTGSFT